MRSGDKKGSRVVPISTADNFKRLERILKESEAVRARSAERLKRTHEL